MLNGLLMTLLFVTAVFLILVVLVQRGRGGGLAGAFGGMGGQSAFGTKAGDLFTRITIVVATIWILLCAASVKLLSTDSDAISRDLGSGPPASSPAGKSTKSGKQAERSPAGTPAKGSGAGTSSPSGRAGGDKGGSPAGAPSRNAD